MPDYADRIQKLKAELAEVARMEIEATAGLTDATELIAATRRQELYADFQRHLTNLLPDFDLDSVFATAYGDDDDE